MESPEKQLEKGVQEKPQGGVGDPNHCSPGPFRSEVTSFDYLGQNGKVALHPNPQVTEINRKFSWP